MTSLSESEVMDENSQANVDCSSNLGDLNVTAEEGDNIGENETEQHPQELIDLQQLCSLLDPFVNTGNASFTMTGEQFLYALARYTDSVAPQEWFNIFNDQVVNFRDEDGVCRPMLPKDMIFEFFQQRVMKEVQIMHKNSKLMKSDQPIREKLAKVNALQKNNNWKKTFCKKLEPGIATNKKEKKFPGLVANILMAFLHLRKTPEEVVSELFQPGSPFLKLKELADNFPDAHVKDMLRNRKFDLPGEFKELLVGVLDKNSPFLVFRSASDALSSVKEAENVRKLYKEEIKRKEKIVDDEDSDDPYEIKAADKKRKELEQRSKSLEAVFNKIKKEAEAVQRTRTKLEKELKFQEEICRQKEENKVVILKLRRLHQNHGDKIEFIDFVEWIVEESKIFPQPTGPDLSSPSTSELTELSDSESSNQSSDSSSSSDFEIISGKSKDAVKQQNPSHLKKVTRLRANLTLPRPLELEKDVAACARSVAESVKTSKLSRKPSKSERSDSPSSSDSEQDREKSVKVAKKNSIAAGEEIVASKPKDCQNTTKQKNLKRKSNVQTEEKKLKSVKVSHKDEATPSLQKTNSKHSSLDASLSSNTQVDVSRKSQENKSDRLESMPELFSCFDQIVVEDLKTK